METQSAKQYPSEQLSSVYILVVEDKLENYVTLARLLEMVGVRDIEWKSTGAGVVQFADNLMRKLDLILLDLGLPYENGYEILARIRVVEHFKYTRVVAVTGSATIEELRKAKKAGFDGFLGKPLDPDRFADQLTRILKGDAVWDYR